MMKFLPRYFSFSTLDYRTIPIYLEQQAQRGLELHRLLPFVPVALFKRRTDAHRSYCCDVQYLTIEQEEDYLSLCAEAGWERIDRQGNLYIFRSAPGEHPTPLHTDPELERHNVLRTFRSYELWTPLSQIMIFALNCRELFTSLLGYTLACWAGLLSLFYILWCLLTLVSNLGMMLHYRFISGRALKQGESLPVCPLPLARFRGIPSALTNLLFTLAIGGLLTVWLRTWTMMLLCLAVLLCLSVGFYWWRTPEDTLYKVSWKPFAGCFVLLLACIALSGTTVNRYYDVTYQISLAQDIPGIIHVADIKPEEASSPCTKARFYQTSSPFVPAMISYEESMDLMSSVGMEWYRCRWPWVAQLIFDASCRKYEDNILDCAEIDAAPYGADRAAAIYLTGVDSFAIILQKGNDVLTVDSMHIADEAYILIIKEKLQQLGTQQ